MSVIYLAKNQVYHTWTKHIDVRFHFICEILDEGGIGLKKINTKDNPADILLRWLQGLSSITTKIYSVSLKCVETFWGRLDKLRVAWSL